MFALNSIIFLLALIDRIESFEYPYRAGSWPVGRWLELLPLNVNGGSRSKTMSSTSTTRNEDERRRRQQQQDDQINSKAIYWPNSMSRPNYRTEERYDQQEEADEIHHEHKQVKYEGHELKEMSYVYPVLLALLILGALFVPFLSLFFFLSVTAFNCNSGLGSSFSPILGGRRRRRRRRRKRDLLIDNVANDNKSNQLLLLGNREDDNDNDYDNNSNIIRLELLDNELIYEKKQQELLLNGNKLIELELDLLSEQLSESTKKLRKAIEDFGKFILIESYNYPIKSNLFSETKSKSKKRKENKLN